MFDKLELLKQTYDNLQEELFDPLISANPQKAIEINKKISDLQEVYDLYKSYREAVLQIEEAKQIIANESDEEMIALGKAQLDEAQENKSQLESDIKIALLPKDPNDDKNIYLEVRPAAGGDEAGLFASELMRAYMRYAEIKGRKPEIIEMDESGIGSLKLGIIKISGEKVYSKLKFESGVHRVQRIPATESKGRVHTSTITVAIMPEIEDVNADVHIDPSDLEMDTYAASSAGGQHANKNETGVRITHKPTGITVNCGDSRSQLQNREKAMKLLKSKIYQIQLEKQQQEQKSKRLDQVGTGDRSEKIRTYNFPQDRITDHRINKSWSNIPAVMNGDLDDIVNTLIVENQAILLAQSQEDLSK